MKVINSIADNLAGGGIGNTAYYFVRYLYQQDMLLKSFSLNSVAKDIPAELISTIKLLGNAKRIMGSINYRVVERMFGRKLPVDMLICEWFDRYVAHQLKRYKDASIYHGWPSMALESFDEATRLNMFTSTEGSSSHPLSQIRLVNEEYQRHGVNITLDTHALSVRRAVNALALVDQIFCASPFVMDSMLQQGISQSKLTLCPFGYDQNLFFPEDNKQSEKLIFIFAGSVMYRKGIQYLLPAFSRLNLKNAELWVIGAIHNEMNAFVNDHRHSSNISFLNPENYIEYSKVIRKGHVFVFPSIEEGSAMVTYEAMASGLPIITTFNSGSVARDGLDGFIVPIRDIDALSEKILEFYNNHNKIKTMGSSASNYIQEFSWEKHGQTRIDVYKKFVSL